MSYGGGGRASLAVGELLPRTIEFRDGEKSPRPCPEKCGGLPADEYPYDELLVVDGGHIPLPLGVKG